MTSADEPDEGLTGPAADFALAKHHLAIHKKVERELGHGLTPEATYITGFVDALIWARASGGLETESIASFLERQATILRYRATRDSERRRDLLGRLSGMTIGDGLLELEATGQRMFVTRDGEDSFQFSFESQYDMIIHGTMSQVVDSLSMNAVEIDEMAKQHRPMPVKESKSRFWRTR